MSSKTPAPLSIRFTESEKTRLRELAGEVPLGTYIRSRALDGDTESRRRRKAPLRDGNALGQVLALLGQSRIANNLNQLAKAANMGTLPLDGETQTDIREACAHVREIRDHLLLALGRTILSEVSQPLPLVRTFNEAARRDRP